MRIGHPGKVRVAPVIVATMGLLLPMSCAHRGAVHPTGSPGLARPPHPTSWKLIGPDSSSAGAAQSPHVPADTSTSNIRVNQDAPGAADQAETSIAINPTNPQNLVGGSMSFTSTDHRNRFYSSLDGGATWVDGNLPRILYPVSNVYDPTVTFCPDGSAYFDGMEQAGGTGIVVFKSMDGGRTWPLHATVVNSPTSDPTPDKAWIECDKSGSQYSGRLYVEYMEVTTTGNQSIKIKYSTNGGSIWSPEVVVSDAPAVQNGTDIAIGLAGEVYLLWARGNSSADPLHGVLLFDKSTNGGVSWGTDLVVGSYDFTPRKHAEGQGALAVDTSTGTHRGTIYYAGADGPTGDMDITFRRSTDGGATWSAPIRVNDDPVGNGAEQMHPAMRVDSKGRVIVTFADNRRHLGQSTYETWGAISRDGGVTFDTNFMISDVPFGDIGWLGDYNSEAVTATTIYPFWADTRSGIPNDSDVYTDRYPNEFDYDEVQGLNWLDKANLDFVPQDARFGVDIDYDVVSGFLSELVADGSFVRASCAAARWPAPPYVDARLPGPDDGYYYLIRAHGPAGVGTYGDGYPLSRVNVRDPLDDSLATCP